jgi:Arc/MetJ-type ribon-helix-helix transcriptional regulator
MSLRQRLSASVDASLLSAVEEAVARGRAPTLSAWVNDALRLKLEHEQRLEALAAFISTYEAGHGEITPAEIAQAQRSVRARAVPVRKRRRSA